MENNKLAIAYRIYPKVSKVPPIFKDDKLKLSELCLKSFKEAFGDLKIKMWVLLDNCPEEYTQLFEKYFKEEELVLISLPGFGNAATFTKQVEILSEQDFSEYIYFAEDDYFYLPESFNEMLELISNNADVHFVTPYDHLDYYKLKLHDYKNKIKFFGKRHWRTGGSTCMTFLTSKSILQKTRKVFLSYAKKNYDSSLWLSLTKSRIRNPFQIIKYILSKNEIKKIFIKAWFHSWAYILFGNKMNLWVPMPSVSTHMDNLHLAPTIDWNKIFEDNIKKINFLK